MAISQAKPTRRLRGLLAARVLTCCAGSPASVRLAAIAAKLQWRTLQSNRVPLNYTIEHLYYTHEQYQGIEDHSD